MKRDAAIVLIYDTQLISVPGYYRNVLFSDFWLSKIMKALICPSPMKLGIFLHVAKMIQGVYGCVYVSIDSHTFIKL